ncbi:MAG: hypothetical protein QG658_111 [Patescibacteria group bacterium]|nr:hypothetical protein [Patescibacteria group bacterium]
MTPNKQASLHTLHFETCGQIEKPQIILLHGIATNHSMWKKLATSLQDEYFVVSIDLLGHGKSPKPKDVTYTADLQVQSIYSTLQQAGLLRESVIVGFSIGALIAARLTSRYPELATVNILVAPPVYQPNKIKALARLDNAYFSLYNLVKRLPQPATLRFIQIVQQSFPALIGNNEYNDQTWHPIMSTVAHTVQQQSFVSDLSSIPSAVQINILHGSLDHLVIKSRLRKAIASRPHTTLHKVFAPHALTRNYVNAIERALLTKSTRELAGV